MALKTRDGGAVLLYASWDTAVPVTLAAAPGAGLQIRVYAVTTHGNGGTMELRNLVGAEVIMNMSGASAGRPIQNASEYGLCVTGPGEGLLFQTGAQSDGTLTYAIEAV